MVRPLPWRDLVVGNRDCAQQGLGHHHVSVEVGGRSERRRLPQATEHSGLTRLRQDGESGGPSTRRDLLTKIRADTVFAATRTGPNGPRSGQSAPQFD